MGYEFHTFGVSKDKQITDMEILEKLKRFNKNDKSIGFVNSVRGIINSKGKDIIISLLVIDLIVTLVLMYNIINKGC